MKINKEKFKKLLYLNGLTQRGLAEKAQIPERTIWSYAQGEKTPRANNASKIAEALNCEIKDFVDMY